jgi:hypothetical protein
MRVAKADCSDLPQVLGPLITNHAVMSPKQGPPQVHGTGDW